jgi:hypothetical protein
MGFLYTFTIIINSLALVLALWLGLYLISRSPKYLLAWLTALNLWFMSGLFINVLLALNSPPPMTYHPAWVHIMFLFWPPGTIEGGENNWLQGWSFTLAIALWHHVTILLRSGKLNAWRWMRIIEGYGLAILAIVVQASTPILFTAESSNPLYLNSLLASPLFPIFVAALIVLTVGGTVNLLRSAVEASATLPRKQLQILAAAILVAGLIGPVSVAGSLLKLPIPIVVMSLLEGIPVGLIGYGVARYSPLMEGRTIQREFFYNLGLLILVILVYFIGSWILVRIFQAPTVILVLIPVLAVITHFMMNSAVRLMDWLFYRRETRRLRSNLQHLVRLVGEGMGVEENLGLTLDTLCTSVRATYGLIFAFEGQVVRQAAAYRWRKETVELKPAVLMADDAIHLAPGQFSAPDNRSVVTRDFAYFDLRSPLRASRLLGF